MRTRKIVGAVAWRHQWDTVSSDVPLLLSDTDRIYIYGPGGRIIEQLDLLDWRVHFLHRDQIGSIRLATNDVGLPAAGADYDPFGRPTTGSTTASVTPLGFAGEYTDIETGLVYLRARYYDPTTGQFISRDPVEQATGDAYAYAENNPLNLVDPLGLCGWRDPWNCGDEVGGFMVRHRHTLIDIGTAVGTAALVGACVATVGCGVAVAATGAAAIGIAGAGTHIASDRLIRDGRSISTGEALFRAGYSTGYGALCGATFHGGCLGAAVNPAKHGLGRALPTMIAADAAILKQGLLNVLFVC